MAAAAAIPTYFEEGSFLTCNFHTKVPLSTIFVVFLKICSHSFEILARSLLWYMHLALALQKQNDMKLVSISFFKATWHCPAEIFTFQSLGQLLRIMLSFSFLHYKKKLQLYQNGLLNPNVYLVTDDSKRLNKNYFSKPKIKILLKPI